MALFWWPWGECVKVCFYLGGLFFKIFYDEQISYICTLVNMLMFYWNPSAIQSCVIEKNEWTSLSHIHVPAQVIRPSLPQRTSTYVCCFQLADSQCH